MLLTKHPIKSWSVPNFDLGGCVLYLPLWRPDMVARGGHIESGTGTMAASPLVLAVGANTVTATGAGTFIIYSPVGGTCASGTATITGSPVTVTAGEATTVTTGITTGTFTVTTNNRVKSKDFYAHTNTITGATWGSQGRTFAGGDDIISIPAHAAFAIADAITVAYWAKPAAQSADYQSLVTRWSTAGLGPPDGRTWTSVIVNASSTSHRWAIQAPVTVFPSMDAANYFTFGSWVFVTDTYDRQYLRVYKNGVAVGTPVAATAALHQVGATATPIVLGCRWDSGTTYDEFTNGVIGDVFVFNRCLPASEIMRLYQITKWRYF